MHAFLQSAWEGRKIRVTNNSRSCTNVCEKSVAGITIGNRRRKPPPNRRAKTYSFEVANSSPRLASLYCNYNTLSSAAGTYMRSSRP